jgi:hypothetical protein
MAKKKAGKKPVIPSNVVLAELSNKPVTFEAIVEATKLDSSIVLLCLCIDFREGAINITENGVILAKKK